MPPEDLVYKVALTFIAIHTGALCYAAFKIYQLWRDR